MLTSTKWLINFHPLFVRTDMTDYFVVVNKIVKKFPSIINVRQADKMESLI